MLIFYYFLKSSLEGVVRDTPYITDIYMGDIGDFVTIDGVGYIIIDYAVEGEKICG